MRSLALLILLAVGGCTSNVLEMGEPFPAHSIWTSPPRPTLPAEADTNDATAYYDLGIAKFRLHPDTAAAAFFWATQLDPWRAEAHYARAVALVRTLWGPIRRSSGLWIQKRRLRLNEFQVVDSLNHLAHNLNPFLHRTFDHLIGAPTGAFICDRIRELVAAALCFMYSSHFALSAEKLTAALKKDPRQIGLHYLRAQAHYHLDHFDSAATDLAVLADSLGRRQEKKLTGFYVSRANIYYAQATAYIQRGDTTAARVAYEKALTENLGFHMASVRLSGRALASGDTAAALSHLAHAVAVSPEDAALRLYYGIILSVHKQSDEAREQFLRAIDINPNFAQPFLHFAQEVETTDPASSVASYETFLMRSARNDPFREWVAERLRRLLGSP